MCNRALARIPTKERPLSQSPSHAAVPSLRLPGAFEATEFPGWCFEVNLEPSQLPIVETTAHEAAGLIGCKTLGDYPSQPQFVERNLVAHWCAQEFTVK